MCNKYGKFNPVLYLTGATLTGGTFNPVSAGQSVVEASTDATFTGGTVSLYQGVSEGSSAGLVISSLQIDLEHNSSQ